MATQIPTAHAGSSTQERVWLIMIGLSLLREFATVRTALFYTDEFELEPGVLINFQKPPKDTSVDIGLTPKVYALGFTSRIAKSQFYLSAGMASRHERFDATSYVALTWQAAGW